MTRSELLSSPEFWEENLKGDLYDMLNSYMKKRGITQQELSFELKVSPQYISKMMRGEYNNTVEKIVQICLHCGKVPVFKFIDLKTYIEDDAKRK